MVNPKKALEFICEIRDRFGEDSESYVQFMNLMTSFGDSYDLEKSTSEKLVTKIQKLLEAHPDLHDQFTKFVPEQTESYQIENNVGKFRLSLVKQKFLFQRFAELEN